jgi:glutaredoxin 3
MQSVLIYTRSEPRCAFCVQAKALLALANLPFTEIDLTTATSERREEFLNRLGRPERPMVPQIFIGNIHVGGYSDLKALSEDSRLQQMVAGE